MKIIWFFLISLILISFNLSANSLSNYDIEGISVGDSALQFFTEKEIKRATNKANNSYKDKSFTRVIFIKHKNLQIYDAISFHYKTNDSNFIIYNVGGLRDYVNKPRECKKFKDILIKDVQKTYPNAEQNDYTAKLKQDKKKKSILDSSNFLLASGDQIRIQCYDWSKQMKHKDHINISLDKAEFTDWMINKAYK